MAIPETAITFVFPAFLKLLEGEIVAGGVKELQGMAVAMRGISAAAERERTHSPLPACG
jgi:hypothetical protein